MRVILPLLFFIFWVGTCSAIDSLATAAVLDTCGHCYRHSPPSPTFSSVHIYNTIAPLLTEPKEANSIQLDVDFHLNSNAVTTTLAGAFLTQRTISEALKNRTIRYAGRYINYEDELKVGVAYKHYFKKPSVTLYVSCYHRNLRSLHTTRDAFELVFRGNKTFEDKTADLSNIYFENLMYNQYSIGVSKSDGHFFGGINASFLQGFSNQQLETKEASLYTAPLGEYLSARYNFTLSQAGQGASKFFDLRGIGFSIDLQAGYSDEKNRINISIQDLGGITWSQNPIKYRADTTVRYDGIAINDLTNISGSGINGLKLDSVLGVLVPKKTNQSYTTNLPSTFALSYSRLLKLKHSTMILTAGISTRLLVNYYAYGYVKGAFALPHQWTTAVTLGGGGYSLFNLGYEVGRSWKHLDFMLGTNNLIGSLLPMYYPGSGFYLRLATHF